MPTLELPETSLHYEVLGPEGSSTTPILFIQGCGVTGEGWRPQMDAFSKTRRVATFDQRGIGKSTLKGRVTIASMTNDARALLDALGWERAHLVGHSMGGVVAQQLALDTPDRVQSLSLLCTFYRGKDGARFTPWLAWIALRCRIGTRAARRRAFLEMVHPRSLLASMSATDKDALAVVLGRFFGRDLADQPSIMMKQVSALGAHDVSARLSTLANIPALVISAEEDRIAHVSQGRALAAHLGPKARYVEMPGAAHGVTIHEAGKVNALLAEHFDA